MSRTVWCRSKPLRLAGRFRSLRVEQWRRVGFSRGGRGDEVDVFVVGPDGGIETTFTCRWWPLAAIVPDRSRRSGQGEAAPVAAAVRGDQLGAYSIGPAGVSEATL
jgi:hypothetical protein